MIESESIYLEKAMESLAGAESEHVNGRYNNAANRCYYASFQAAVYALERAGVQPRNAGATWSHEGLQATFARELIIRRKLYASDVRAILTLNESLRESADYRRHWVSETQAQRAVRRTRSFVAAVREGGHR